MVKKLQTDEIPEGLRDISTSHYKCDVCGCIFNDIQAAQQCEYKHGLNEPPKS